VAKVIGLRPPPQDLKDLLLHLHQLAALSDIHFCFHLAYYRADMSGVPPVT